MTINLLLLFDAVAIAYLGVCGRTIETGRAPLFERLTLRGKITLLLIIAAVVLGFFRETQEKTDGVSGQNQLVADQATQKDLTNVIDNLSLQVGGINQELADTINGNMTDGFVGLVQSATGYDNKDWSRLMSYRLSLRFLLCQLCKQKAIRNNDSNGLTDMLNQLHAKAAISKDLYNSLKRVAIYTYYAECGPGKNAVQPDKTELLQMKTYAPEALQALQALIKT